MTRLARRVPPRVKQQVIEAVPNAIWRRLRAFVHGQSAPQRGWRRLQLSHLNRQRRRRNDHALVPLVFDGEGYLAHTVTRFTAEETFALHLNLVADALTEHHVEFAVLDAQPQRRRVLVVAEPHREAALQALSESLSDGATYLASVRHDSVSFPRLLSRLGTPPRANVVRVFQVFASGEGRYLGGPELGCDVEFWAESSQQGKTANGEPVEAGALVAPRSNRWVDVIRPADRTPPHAVVDGIERPVFTALADHHLFSTTEPIDVVYTWVDGSDEKWSSRKREVEESLGRSPELHQTAFNQSRFLSRDELRYSLRSLDMYASWVRHIYLVTDDQVPAWLTLDHPRLTVVSHAELFGDRGTLPTYNSHAIESQLHRIEGLSEHYLYLNDDVFFGRPVTPELFVHSNGLAKFFLSPAKMGLGPVTNLDPPVITAAKNNRALLDRLYNRTVSNKFKHVPHSLRRSVIFELEKEFETEFETTASAQFRSPSDLSISAALHHYYAYATGRAVPAQIGYFYADIADPETPYRLSVLLEERSYDVFCLNDHDSSTVDENNQAKTVHDFLDAYYPVPSAFELPTSKALGNGK